MEKYISTIEITRRDFDRINRLMDVRFEECETDPEMQKLTEELDAKPDDMAYGFGFSFDDGSKILIDIRSGGSNYFDDCRWVSADDKFDDVFDCWYKLKEENQFVHNDIVYVCKFNIVEG